MLTKISLRRMILARQKGISSVRRHAKNRKILRRLLKDPVFRKAEHVAIYYGIPPEVETHLFLNKIPEGKKIYLPKVNPKKKTLTLCRVLRVSKDLKKGVYNIMEPKAFCVKRPASRMDLIIAPGVAFDKKGGRLGRGGGYYDRLLRRAKKVPTIGLCFREQLVKKVPMNAHDIRVDKVITD